MSEPQNVPHQPNFVWARRPQSPVPDWIGLMAHPETLSKVLHMGMRSKMGEYWGQVHGNFPANPEFHHTPDRTSGLKRPVAIFKGVKRPLHDGMVSCDKDILVYVTNPELNYCLRGSRDGAIIEQAVLPVNSVFTTFVTLQPERVDAARNNMPKAAPYLVGGLVLFWEWTEASSIDPRFPLDYDTRYDGQLL